MEKYGSLIVTADDANIIGAIDLAIVELASLGVVTNIAAFMSGEPTRQFSEIVASDASIGIHFNLTYGRPKRNPEDIQSLVDVRTGNFFAPRDFIESGDSSLFDAIHRHQNEVVSQYAAEEIKMELRSQMACFDELQIPTEGRHSFHQDLDKVDRVSELLASDPDLPETRALQLKSKSICGFHYKLFPPEADLNNCQSEVLAMLHKAVRTSSNEGGIPFEIALHPSISCAGLREFTEYTQQREMEFAVWSSGPVRDFFASGERIGNEIRFPVSSLGGLQ